MEQIRKPYEISLRLVVVRMIKEGHTREMKSIAIVNVTEASGDTFGDIKYFAHYEI